MSAPAASQQPTRSPRRAITITIVVLVVLATAFFIAATLAADVLWYQQTGYLEVLTTQWIARVVLFAVGFLGMAIPVWLGLFIAFRNRPIYTKLDPQQQLVDGLRPLATWAVPLALGFFAGLSAAGQWRSALLWLNSTPFGETDPEFGLDIGFYFFDLPFYQGVVGFALWAVALSGLAALAIAFVFRSIRLIGRRPHIDRAARVQLAVTLGLWIALQALNIWLGRYATLHESSAGFLQTGAGYTEVNAIIPGQAILAIAAAFVALLCFATAMIGRWQLPAIGVVLLVVLSLVIGAGYPWIVQRFQVEPSARTVEAPYIERSIAATRDAFGVAGLEEIPYSATTNATQGALREDAATTANIRIIDPTIAPRTFQQLQQLKQYYGFHDLDVDRYEIDGKVQDTIIALRDLNLAGLGDSQSWYNNTVVYTHGYGVVAAYGNQREPDGEPRFLEYDINQTGALGEYEPRIYFGEGSPEYSIVGAPEGSAPIELDYPAGGEDSTRTVQTTFTEDGGPKLDNLFNRIVYAIKFQSEQILFSDAVNDNSQILYDRDPRTRVQKVAPYLSLDTDPYPAIVDGRIVWIVDGYTTGTNYPYSETVDLVRAIADADTTVNTLLQHRVNYLRNSVKATVDAYDGTVTLYAWDDEDPVLTAWQQIFPSTVVPASEMSDDLLAHVRYPEDLFKVQRQILGTYHVTDTNSFYSGDDRWVTPQDPVASSALQPPYYLTMQTPGSDKPAYTLYSTYIPAETGTTQRQILTGYLAANGDAGEDYGKLTLLTLPTQSIPAPGQVFNAFKTNTQVSSEVLDLTAGGGNNVIYGNLLTLPVGGGLLYVQPVYVQSSSGTQFPLLRKILVSFGADIAFEDTLDEALDVLFGGDSGAEAGDSGEATEPTPEPTTPTTPVDPEAPTTPSTPGDYGPELRAALADYQAALADRTAAYARGDLVAAAEADQRMVAAIERALAATDG